MRDPVTIPATPPTDPGLSYSLLKEEGTRRVQRLAGSIWTDYNEHDPGVTTLEQLCYALTELSYRADLPLADLLTDPLTGRIDPHRQALFIPARILPCNPLTVADYRKLIVDRVAGVGNAWLFPLAPEESGGVAGFYRIVLYLPQIARCPGDPGTDPATAAEATRRLYLAHRNLCEELSAVDCLQPVAVTVAAAVTVEAAADPDEVLAALLFDLGLCLAPELRRYPLDDLLARGERAAEIFTGPLLEHGFIADDQLLPLPTVISLQELVRVTAAAAGVAGVRQLQVTVGEGSPTAEGCVDLPAGTIGSLVTAPGADGRYSIRLYRNGAECRPDPLRVQRALSRRWSDYRRDYPLANQYEEYFGFPTGRVRNLAEYYSIQNQYPVCYGIGSYGLPGDAAAARRGQARQLKGYLLPFEQLLADYFAQLTRLRDLYSLEPRLRCDPVGGPVDEPGAGAGDDGAGQCTYFYQYLERSVPQVEPLLKRAAPGAPGYRRALAELVRSQDPGVARRNGFLAFLLALYAETLGEGELSTADCDGAAGRPADETLLRARLALLHRLVASGHNRARSFDYLAPPGPGNVAGMTIKSRIQLDLALDDPAPLLDGLQALGMELAEGEGDATFGRTLGRHNAAIDEEFQPLHLHPLYAAAAGGGAPEAAAPDGMPGGAPRRVTEALLAACSDPANLRLGRIPAVDGVVAVGRTPGEGTWRLLGRFPDEEAACGEMGALVERVQGFYRRRRRLYVVEHNLLRFGLGEEGDDAFPLSLTLTAVTSAPSSASAADDGSARSTIAGILRDNTPAHLACELCLLDLGRMMAFEERYWAWRDALQAQRPRRLAETSARLRRFLRRCRSWGE